MTEEKQIEEMAKVISNIPPIEFPFGSRLQGRRIYTSTKIAEALYNAGYRKQSEGEWLPSPDGIQPIRCSKCNMPAPFVAGENEFGDFEICRYPSRYCHECGAKMKCGAE